MVNPDLAAGCSATDLASISVLCTVSNEVTVTLTVSEDFPGYIVYCTLRISTAVDTVVPVS